MSFLTDLWDLTKRFATIDSTLEDVEETLDEVAGEMKIFGERISKVESRVDTLERERDLLKGQLHVALREVQLEVERFELRLRQLPPSS